MNRIALLVMLLAGCGSEMNDPALVDGRPGIDGGVGADPPPDAGAADAMLAPPIDPTDDVCQYLPMEDFGQMANYPVRFGNGQGLEISPDIRQTGLLELTNADVGKRDVIEKRTGAVQLGDSRSTTPGDVVPDAARRALWTRGREVLLQTNDSIYKEQQAVTTFTWLRAASWIQTRLREAYANTFASDVFVADHAKIGDATLVASQEGTSLPTFAIYGPTLAREVLETLPTTSPTKVRMTSPEDIAVISFQDQVAGFPLRARTWTPGAAGTAAFSTIVVTMGAPAGIWDVHSAKTAVFGDLVTAWMAAAPTAAEGRLSVRFGGVVGSQNFAAAPANLADVAVVVWPRRVAGGTAIRVVTLRAFSNAGVWTVNNSWIDFDAVTGAVVASVGASTALADAVSQVHSVALSFTDVDNVYVAVEQTSLTSPASSARKVTYYTLARSAGLVAANIVHESTSLVRQGAIISGTPSDTLVSAGAEPLNPGFGEQLLGGTVGVRSGWVIYAPRTNEVVARSFVGFTGDLTARATKPPKGSLIASGDLITWGGPAAVPSEPAGALRAVAICKLDRAARANKPAYLDGTAVSAHAGYPRAYDGTRAFEHDWHTLPRITTTATGVAGGTTTAGNHFVAVTWEADDANGLRYRSAPGFEPSAIVSGGVVGNSAITVTIEPMTHTERANVRAVVWMTRAGFPQYHRAVDAAVTGAAQTITVSVNDVTLSLREVLDQAPVSSGQGVVASVPARVTDFVALLIDRLASRDPRVGSVMRFTTPSREASGYPAHWYAAGLVQEALERDITTAIEMDGRIVMGTRLGFSQLQGDGPDATGAGSFGIPLVVRAPIGIEDHTLTERSPLGYLFGSALGPRVLTPGLSVGDIHEAVARQYEIEGGELVGIAYNELEEEIVWLDSTVQTLRLNTHNARWAADTARLGRDIAKRDDGVVYLLRSDGKVLRQDPDVYTDGAATYDTRVSFRLREPARDGLAHGGFVFNGLEVFGEYLGAHDLNVRVTVDFRDGSTVFEGTVPAGTLATNAADGRDYRYALYTPGIHCYAARCEVELDGAGVTARLDGIDVRYNSDGSADAAQLPEEQRIPLETSAV